MSYAEETEKFRLKMDILLAPYQDRVTVAQSDNITTERWMSPLKLFEYMAAGKAIICSDIPVLREILENDMMETFCPDETAKKLFLYYARTIRDVQFADYGQA